MQDFGLQGTIFENRTAEYIDVFEERKRRKAGLAGQKPKIGDMPYKEFPGLKGPWNGFTGH
ncbi:hypothetical protein [Micavibrio aeruginosavorus]|uniref:hypothetical protein n=1 Tax=Micavibrio aeruginosavorus TaxID=349221 RepID=UPI003F4ABAF2